MKPKLTLQILFLFLHCVLSSLNGFSKIDSQVDRVPTYQVFDDKCNKLARFALIIEDKNDTLTIEDIRKGYIERNGSFLKNDVTNLDFTTSSYWIKFRLKNMSALSREFMLEVARPLTNRADLYIENSWHQFEVKKNGDYIPFKEREIKHRKLIFPIDFRPHETLTFYLNIASDGEVINLPISLLNKKTLNEDDYYQQLFLGLFYGILIFVAIIYTFFFFALRERSFLYYVIYIVCLTFMQFSIDGLAFQFLWPYSTWMGNHAILIFSCLVIIFILLYSRYFLKISENSTVLNRIFKFFIGLGVITLFNSLFDSPTYYLSFPMANALGLLAIILIIISIAYIKRKQGKVNVFFTVAFICFFIGAILFILGNFNIVEPNWFTEQGVKIGSAFEVIFLSLSMANRYREIQKEKEEAQGQLIESLEEKNKLKDEINIELEKQVQIRTQQINKQKEELAHKNKEVTDSINYAKGIQDAILPHDDFLQSFVQDSFILFRPKDIVSGDFYWMNENEQYVFVAVADCTGHGVPGGFVSMVGANSLKQTINEYKLNEPADILDKLSELVEQAFKKRNDGMDISLVRISKQLINNKREIKWAGANNPFWAIREKEGEFFEIKPDKQPIGNYDYRKPFTDHIVDLDQGDIMYLFTDGYADQFGGEKGKKFKYSSFRALLLKNHTQPMKEQCQLLNDTIKIWMGSDYEQIDDICIIGIKI